MDEARQRRAFQMGGLQEVSHNQGPAFPVEKHGLPQLTLPPKDQLIYVLRPPGLRRIPKDAVKG